MTRRARPALLLIAGSAIGIFGLALVQTRRAGAQEASGADAHKIFEQRCMRCHTMHGADLARQMLKLTNGEVQVARTGKPVAGLLAKHHGVSLAEPELAALLQLFKDGIARKGAFQHRCALCHDRAADFARAKLTIKDGALVTKGGVDAASFLKTHHEATPEELAVIVTMLKAQLAVRQ